MEAQQHVWWTSELWLELKTRAQEPAPKLKHLVEGLLPDIETVLNKGDTMPGNFTLHDGEHSWRVAKWMADLAGETLSQLSSQDLAMLLLSAYLHDIGMTPPLGKVRSHYVLLLTGDPGTLSEGEAAELQAWLDDAWGGLVPPIATGAPSDADIRLVDEITAAYVRHRHNDWSEVWIQEHVAPLAKGMYPGWVDDLVRLCRSHHFGIDELKGDGFNPRLVGSPATVLHLRYCACLLRVADVLDFDPERTPPILFKHRDVGEQSAIFWHKDLGLSFVQEANHLLLEARPEDALTQHAIEQTIAGVNRELSLCRRLDDETSFQRLTNSERILPQRWTLDSDVKANVVPRDGAYEYVDGSFRPDTRKLLDLLAGTALYGSPLAAVRELLQNAFDAVREQIARERLNAPDPADTQTRDRLAAVKRVSLVLERSESGLRLVCHDTGVGMSGEIVTTRFLVGGTTAGHEIRLLERECANRGFSVGRTAQFGIGVLSYFMLADNLVIRSRRSNEGGDPDGTGWTFSSPGLDGFGELKRDPGCPVGTTVELDIRDDVFDDEEAFADILAAYVEQIVRRTPCAFSFTAPDFELPGFECDPGWPDRDDDAVESLLGGAPLYGAGRQTLVLDVDEGDLPDGLGTYRIFFGYFELDTGPSLAHLDFSPADRGEYFIGGHGRGHGTLAISNTSESWNGMSIGADLDVTFDQTMDEKSLALESAVPPRNAYVEIDWTSDRAGRLMVNRDSFNPSAAALDAIRAVHERSRELLSDFVSKNADFPVSLLNAHLAGILPNAVDTAPYWLHDEGDEFEQRFAPLRLPIIDTGVDYDVGRLQWRGRAVDFPAVIEILDPGEGREAVHWYWPFKPHRVGAIVAGSEVAPAVVWEKFELRDDASYRPHRAAVEFPPTWGTLVGLRALRDQERPMVWNREHPLLRAVDNASWEWAAAAFQPLDGKGSRDPLPHRAELLSSEANAAAWILMCLEMTEGGLWSNLAEHSPDLLLEAWNKVDGLAELGKILLFGESYLGMELSEITASAWTTYETGFAREFSRQLGVPDEDWRLEPAPPAA